VGTWDIGPFDNDTAADFAGALDGAAEGEREGILRGALLRTAEAEGCLDGDLAVEAVAAAALVAAQCPDGEPVSMTSGPRRPLPRLPDDLRALGVRALDRVVTGPSELMELWGESDRSGPWRAGISQLREVLAGGDVRAEGLSPGPGTGQGDGA
jgi:hypothetical protein